MPTWLGNQISLSPHNDHATLHSFGILIAPHPSEVRFHPSEPLAQVRTQLDKGNTSVSERYKTRLLEPEEVTHCQNLTFIHLETGSMLGNFHAMVIPDPSRRKLYLGKFFQHLPIFAGNSRFTGISQLRAGKTRSKRPRSHCLSTGHLLPYM